MTRPNIQIPKEFAINGEKADFTQEKMQTGFDKLNPDIFAGDNINKFIDDTYKGLNGVLDLYNGVVLHEMTTTYDDKAVVGKFIENRFKLYRSLVNDNTGHEVTETEYWEEVALGGGSGFNLFDTKVSDHILKGEEALGWALQGTYVYKEGVAGSRTGYADFYNKCLAEKENSTATETTLGDNTITMYVNANGHKFYDIADKTVVDNWYNTYGIADYYGVDTENERIFLPRDKYFAVTGGVMGNGMTLGLTDGTNNAGVFISNAGLTESSNNYGTNVGYSFTTTGGLTNNKSVGVTTDPTKSGIALEPNTDKYLYICVGNTKVESALSNVTEITTSENDTLPLFYNFYSKEDMTTTGAYVNASLGSWLSGNVYATAYNELVNKLGTDNVKANTDTYTDYDFVVNQDDVTFRLPLLNGSENLSDYNNAITLTRNVEFICPDNGYIKLQYGAGAFNLTVNGVVAGSYNNSLSASAFSSTNVYPVKRGDVVLVGNVDGGATFYSNKGNGNLYYKVANAVTNLELLDVAKVTADLNTKLSRDNKEEIIAWGIPDYTAGISYATTGNISFIAPVKGYFSLNLMGTGGQVTINGNDIGELRYVTGYSLFPNLIPLDKNDVLAISGNTTINGGCYFFPMKGAN